MAPAQGYKFKTLSIKELHPTFGAEVSGLDFSQNIPDDAFEEILKAMAKVSTLLVVFWELLTV
jgi:alpha-ketoglutarate-dependent 2,4-dichlorophenoxyacetate dioxygenase